MMPESGQHLGQYLVKETLGTGKATLTCRAEDPAAQRDVVLKVLGAELAADAERRRKFERQASELKTLAHPGLAAVLDVYDEAGSVFYAREFIPGASLRVRLQQGVTPAEALLIVRQLAEALEVAHTAGHVHRAVKPKNILFRADGRAVLADFGLAGTLDSDPKIGLDPHYVSPEQARGEQAGPRSDLYSLGVVLYELLTGSIPYQADSDFRIAMLHIHGPLPKLPVELGDYQGMLDGLLAKKITERIADAAALIKALDALPAPSAELPPAMADATNSSTEPTTMSTVPPAGNEPLPPADPPVWAEIAALSDKAPTAAAQDAVSEPVAPAAEAVIEDQNTVAASAVQPSGTDSTVAAPPAVEPPKPVKTASGPKDPLLLWMSVAAIVGAILIVLGYVFWHQPVTRAKATVSQEDRTISETLASAERLIQQGHPAAAMKTYQDLLKTYPKRPEPYNNLAALYAEQGNLDAAKATLEKGIQTNPVYGTIYKNLGMIYAQIARNSYGKALQLGTRPTIPHLALLDPMAPASVTPAPAPAKPAAVKPAVQAPAAAVKVAAVVSKPQVTATQPAKPAAAKPAAQAPAPAAKVAAALPKPQVAATPAQAPATATPKQAAAKLAPASEAPLLAAPPQPRAPVVSQNQAILDTVLAWAQAWSDKDYAAYSSFYADSYQPLGERSRTQWEALRRRRLERPQWIKIALSNIQIKPAGQNQAQVTFVQQYSSNLFHDVSRKSLDLVETDGRWRIAAERSLGAVK